MRSFKLNPILLSLAASISFSAFSSEATAPDSQGSESSLKLEQIVVTAQKKVEENNFGIRKRLLEYDDVMNSQRTIIYTLRKNALKGEKLKIDISNMLFDTVQEIVVSNKEANNYKNFDFDLITNFSVTSPISEEDFNNKDDSEIIEILYKNLSDYYERKKEINKELAFPVIKNVFENKIENASFY